MPIQLKPQLYRFYLIFLLMQFVGAQVAYTSSIENYSINDGLSQSDVTGIIKDDLGFLWIGTQDGLNRFDGYEFKVYKPDPEKPEQSLTHQVITSLYRMPDGDIWVGTSSGLNRYLPEIDQFEHVHLSELVEKGNMPLFHVSALTKSGNDELWIGTGRLGVYLYHTQNKTIRQIPIQGIDDYTNLVIRTIFTDLNGNTWLSIIEHGIYKYDPQNDIFSQKNILRQAGYKSNIVNTIFQNNSRELWFGTEQGLFLYSPQENKTTRIKFKNDSYYNLIQKSIVGIFEEKSGHISIVNEFGDIFQLDQQENRLIEHPRIKNIHSYIHNNRIFCIYPDNEGLVWLGASGTGLIKIDISKNFFQQLTYDPKAQVSLSDNVVWSVYQDQDENIWAGTDVGGLNVINLKNNTNTVYRNIPGNPKSLSDDRVWAIYEDKMNQIWIGTGSGGINLYQPKTKTFKRYVHQKNNPLSLLNNTVYCFFEDSNHNFWVGTEEGLEKFNRKKGTFEHYVHDPNDPNSLCYNRVGSIIEPEPGILWIGTLGGGISRFDYINNLFTSFQTTGPASLGLNNDYILSLYLDSDSTVWVGTWGSGLSKFDKSLECFLTTPIPELSNGNSIHSIQKDKDGNLWASTNKGLIKYNPNSHQSLQFTHLEGLPSNEFNTGASYQNPKGQIFLGSIAGLVWFTPEKSEINTYIPPVVITDFQIMNESVKPTQVYNKYQVLKKSIPLADTINMSYKDKIISFEFASLNYHATSKNQYLYKMIGVDKDWIQPGNRRFATYTNLSPGEYEFQVRGSNNDGVWNRKGDQVLIIIHPPFWMTFWFRVTFIIITVTAIAGIFIVQTRSMKKRNKYLQAINDNLKEEINERKRFEQELQDQKAFLETVFNGIQEGIAIVDTNERITFLNKGVATMMGQPEEELLNKSMLNMFSKDQHKLILEETDKRKKGQSSQYELRYDHPDGKKRYFRISVSPLFDHYNNYKGSIGALLDITNIKKAQENQKIMEAQLRHAQKMEIIGTLAGGIAHDFNNILVPIIGYTEISLDLLPKDGLVKTNLEKILKASKRAKDLVQQILAFSRQEQQGLEPVEIHILVNEALKLLRSSFPSTIQIHSNIDTHTGTVLADPTQIHQVIMNLCTNALHAMRENGGLLDVTVTRVVLNEKQVEKYKHIQADKPYVLLRVSDTGVGMDKIVLSRIFEPFFTTKKVGEGTGLGLSAVHGIILSHGGDIHVDSTPGVGSVFEIFVPQYTETAVKKKSNIPENIPQGNENVLFVDDEEEIVLLYQQILESLGYNVIPFTNSVEALEAFRQKPNEFQLVITDHTMPYMTGTELSKAILAIKAEQPIIMCTGYSENVTQEKALQIGIKEFIIKPLTMANIANAIRKVLDKSPAHQTQD